MEISFEGFDDLERKIRELAKGAEDLEGEHSVSFEELFPEVFMRANTDFESIDQMIESSGFKIETTEEFEAIPDDEWDTFIGEHTRFADWDEMMGSAVEDWAVGKLDL